MTSETTNASPSTVRGLAGSGWCRVLISGFRSATGSLLHLGSQCNLSDTSLPANVHDAHHALHGAALIAGDRDGGLCRVAARELAGKLRQGKRLAVDLHAAVVQQ